MRSSSMFHLLLIALLLHSVLSSKGGIAVDSASGKSTLLVKGNCNVDECKKIAKSQETILESEDYIYTQSLP
ncbi:hypothetical protein ACS0TY_029822 [Phlomoides rotata]